MIASSTVTGCRFVERERTSGERMLPSTWFAITKTPIVNRAVSGLTVSASRTAGTAPITGPR